MEIRLASTQEELDAARRFWYQVYVVDMGRHVDDVDITCHETRTLRDKFDATGRLFLAWHDRQVVGSVLMTYFGQCSSFGYYDTLYRLDGLPIERRLYTSITNKLMVGPEWRRSWLAIRLAQAIYRDAYGAGIQQTYIDCNDHLLEFFKRLGFVPHLGWVTHKDYGQTMSMVLNLFDQDHLQAVNSPFASEMLERKALLKEGSQLSA